MSAQEPKERIKCLEQIIAFCKSMISLPSPEKRNEETERLIETLQTEGFIDADFVETEENKSYKTQLIKAVLIFDDLSIYDGAFVALRGRLDSVCRMYQATKNSFLPLALLKANINGWGRYHVDDQKMNKLKDKIFPGLEFANHVRNKITGHLENEVIGNSVQWEPTIFQDSRKDNDNIQRILIYRSVLESAINSYIDNETGVHKIFNQEIDIVFPDTSKLFYTYLQSLIKDSLLYLQLLINNLNAKIIYCHGLPANLLKSASETEFKTKKKGR